MGKIPWRRAWQPTPVFVPGESPRTEEPGGLPSMGLQSWTQHISCLSEGEGRRGQLKIGQRGGMAEERGYVTGFWKQEKTDTVCTHRGKFLPFPTQDTDAPGRAPRGHTCSPLLLVYTSPRQRPGLDQQWAAEFRTPWAAGLGARPGVDERYRGTQGGAGRESKSLTRAGSSHGTLPWYKRRHRGLCVKGTCPRSPSMSWVGP